MIKVLRPMLFSSLVFYSYGEPKFVLIMILSIIVNYCLALGIDWESTQLNTSWAKTILVIDIIINLGILFVYKYLDFSISTLNVIMGTSRPLFGMVLPIGISFFTFQAMSYVVDVYRRRVEVQKNLFLLALYISFFPQLVAGPIVRYTTIENQIRCRVCTPEKFAEGNRRFFLGFGKKMILANNLSEAAGDF